MPVRNSENFDDSYKFFIKNERPEETHRDPLKYYVKEEIKNYAESKNLMRTQEKLTKRALSIIDARPPARVLDIGMGCGFSTIYLYINNYDTVGIDIHFGLLSYYRDLNINPIQSDMRFSTFRPNSFDLITSISAVQWLFSNTDTMSVQNNLKGLVKLCEHVLKPDGKIVIQFYPKSDDDMNELGHAFSKSGSFTGGFMIDNPENPVKRKIFLTLEKKKKIISYCEKSMGGDRPKIDAYYGIEAEEYGKSKWMMKNQIKTTQKAIVFLESEIIGGKIEEDFENLIVLDIGCGTGYSSITLIESGFRTIGMDISPDMIYQLPKYQFRDLNLILADMRHIPLRHQYIDNIISISAFNFASEGGSNERDFKKNIHSCVSEVHRILKKSGRIIIEFYPTEKELEQFNNSLKRLGFDGGLLIEHQHTRKEKKYLLLKKE